MNEDKFWLSIMSLLIITIGACIIVPVTLHYHLRNQQVAKYTDQEMRLDTCIHSVPNINDGNTQWCISNVK